LSHTPTEARWQALEALRAINPPDALIIDIDKEIDRLIADRHKIDVAERLWGSRQYTLEEVKRIRREAGL
jgi:hypothetical protein